MKSFADQRAMEENKARAFAVLSKPSESNTVKIERTIGYSDIAEPSKKFNEVANKNNKSLEELMHLKPTEGRYKISGYEEIDQLRMDELFNLLSKALTHLDYYGCSLCGSCLEDLVPTEVWDWFKANKDSFQKEMAKTKALAKLTKEDREVLGL